MAKDVLHVVPHDDVWAVKREGNERASSTHPTQKDAIDAARELAHEGDDLVIHRPDGTIRDRTTYTGSQSVASKSDTPVQPHDILSVGSRVSWQAILAGVAVALTVYVCLILFATAIGLSSVDYLRSKTFAITAACVGIFSLLAALFAGGYVTTRLTTRETLDEAIIYGILLWAALFFVVLLTGINLGSSFGMMTQVARQTAPEPASTATATEMEARRAQMQAKGEEFLNEMNPVALAWWTLGGMVLSVLAAIGGTITGCGPELIFRRTWTEQTRTTNGRVVREPAAV